jgi:hypothetical protein
MEALILIDCYERHLMFILYRSFRKILLPYNLTPS